MMKFTRLQVNLATPHMTTCKSFLNHFLLKLGNIANIVLRNASSNVAAHHSFFEYSHRDVGYWAYRYFSSIEAKSRRV